MFFFFNCQFVFCVSVEAVVLYDYTAQEPDELTLKKGDVITKIQIIERGWWEGTISKDGKRGLFPDNFVKVFYRIY